ncbi:MAG: outer membrane beta-barrel protein [Bacteroidota bacterium]
MKKKQFLLTLALASFCLFTAQAQVHFGATTTLNTTFVLDEGLSSNRYNSQINYEWAPIGFSFGVDLGKRFGLQLESILADQGQIFEIVDVAKNVVGERRIDVSYVQLPLFLKFMSGKDNRARTNFSFGPQLSLLRNGVETIQYNASTQFIPDGDVIPDGAVLNADGSYEVPELPTTELLSSAAQEQIRRFRESEFQIAMAFGVDIDISKHLYLSTQIRANYSLTDMRNGDLVDLLREGNIGDIFNRRANLAVGAQFGLNFVIGGTRTYKAKQKEENSARVNSALGR